MSRVSPAIEVETSFPARKVIEVLLIETFNAKVRAECLDQHWFTSLAI